MRQEKTLYKECEIAKEIITEEIQKSGLKVEKIYLFGSRARGDFNKDSDWDFFVVVDKDIDFTQKRKIILNIRRRLSEKKIPSDIIIQSQQIIKQRKDNTGYLTYYVLREGIKI